MADGREDATAMSGVDRLRGRRGEQRVTFNDVADHIEDFVHREAAARESLDRFAAFLAAVEDADHEHEGIGPTLP